MKKKKKTLTPFRIAAAIMLLPLLASVLVQYNDPDGLVWMLIYGYGAFLTIPAIFGLYSAWAIPGALGYLGGFAYLVPYFESPVLKSELTREGGGVLIAGVWMLCIAGAWYWKRKPMPVPVPTGTLQMVRPTTSGSGGGGGCGSGSCGCGKK